MKKNVVSITHHHQNPPPPPHQTKSIHLRLRTHVRNVFQNFARVLKTFGLGNFTHAFGTARAFRVNPDDLARVITRHGVDGQRKHQLCFARTGFTVNFGQVFAVDTTTQQFIEFGTAGGNGDGPLLLDQLRREKRGNGQHHHQPLLFLLLRRRRRSNSNNIEQPSTKSNQIKSNQHTATYNIGRSGEAVPLYFLLDGFDQFVVLGVGEAFDGDQLFFRRGTNLLKGMESGVLQFLDVAGIDAEGFKDFNVDHFFFFDVHVVVFLVVCNGGGSTDHGCW
jgi:hypothetical protein